MPRGPHVVPATLLALGVLGVGAAAAGQSERPGPAPNKQPQPVERVALEGALRAGRLVAPRLDAGRARILASVLLQARGGAATKDPAGLRVLTETVRTNAAQLRRGSRSHDVVVRSGVVYRSYGSRGYQFQPLASFGRLNVELAAGRRAAAQRLARSLLARATADGGTLRWQYYFRAYGGAGPWTSGLTQAVAAQALARGGRIAEARRAFAALPSALVMELPAGPWVRLYSFSNTVVLNAQLQTILSLRDYGNRAGDRRALVLSDRLARTAKRLLKRFDSGWWSRYSLDGAPASIAYHRYVTSLLWKLARTLRDDSWSLLAARFRDDWRQPPRMSALRAPHTVYVLPSGNGRVRVSFHLSKLARVGVRVGTMSLDRWLQPGRHAVSWRPGRTTPSSARVILTATDYAGNTSRRRLAPIAVERDTRPPALRVVELRNGLAWHAADDVSPHVTAWIAWRTAAGLRPTIVARGQRSGVVFAAPLGATPVWLAVADGSGNTSWAWIAGGAPPPLQPLVQLPLPPAQPALRWIR
jgi:hypothetical protein